MRRLLLFSLLASSLAAQSQAVLAALATGTYFPLDVGDRWVYRIDTRISQADYQVWRIDRTQDFGGKTYSVMAIENPSIGLLGESWFRTGDNGRVYLLTGNGEQIFLDPTAQPDPKAVLSVTATGKPYSGGLGSFSDGIMYFNFIDGLSAEFGQLIRGIGLVGSTLNLETGSSGGLLTGRTLVEASVAGGIHLTLGTPSMQLGIESLTLDLTGKQAPNCAIPCYFVACGLVPGADPPGTYKPCARARVSLTNWPTGRNRTVNVQVLGPDGKVIGTNKFVMDAAPDEAVSQFQVILYAAPNVPYPPGSYKLVATTGDGAAQSSLTLQLQ